MEKKIVNILGTEYEVEFNHEDKQSDGQAFFYKNKIEIKPTDGMLDEELSVEEKKETAKGSFQTRTFSLLFPRGGK